MLLLDTSHTSHTRAMTGVQRVVRQLHGALGSRARAITFDPYLRRWRELRAWERRNLSWAAPGKQRGASWPLSAKLAGVTQRWLASGSRSLARLPAATGTLLPEIFGPAIAARLTDLPRPIVGVFHDAIALKLPELTPVKTVARFPGYLQELRQCDGIAAVSEDSARALMEYWQWLGVNSTPPIRVVPLGIEPVAPAAIGPSDRSRPIVLSVGSIEGRKNHLALLDACERLWVKGANFELHLMGMARRETAAAALARIADLQNRGRPIRHDQGADDAALSRAYAAATFTVYPSLMEGFGLPVLESVAHGKPCICSGRGALGEAAEGGGCLTLEQVEPADLADAVERLLSDTTLRQKLSADARGRKLRTWAQYADDLVAFVTELKAR